MSSLALANVSVHEIPIKRTLNNKGADGRAAWRKSLFSKKNIANCVQFVKDHMKNAEG